MDQATRLRELARKRTGDVLAVLSGKGGVGKTNIALGLGILARRSRRRVLVWDADFGLANCDVLLDVAPKHTIADLMSGEVRLADALVHGPGDIQVLPAASGLRQVVELGPAERRRLRELFDEARRGFDLIVVDNAAGIGESVISFALWADSILLTTSPEVPAVADAYATAKVLSQAGRSKGIKLLVNMARDRTEAERIGGRIKHVSQRFLGLDIDLVGWVPEDWHVPEAVSARKPFVLYFPDCPAAQALADVWERIDAPAAEPAASCMGGSR
jgi:flagellar biosynthesis protein FlhG